MTDPARRERADSARFDAVATALLREGRPVRFRAHGWSMQPAINDGDAIVVEPLFPAEVRLGDVLLFRASRGLTAHRVTTIDNSRGPRRLVLQGDAASEADPAIVDADVLGRVVAVERTRTSWTQCRWLRALLDRLPGLKAPAYVRRALPRLKTPATSRRIRTRLRRLLAASGR